MSDREYRFSVSVKTDEGDLLTVRGDAIEEIAEQHAALTAWYRGKERPEADASESRQRPPDGAGGATAAQEADEYIPMVQEKKGAKSPPLKCKTCGNRHEFFVNQSSKDGSYFLSVKRGDAWHYPVDGPISWQAA